MLVSEALVFTCMFAREVPCDLKWYHVIKVFWMWSAETLLKSSITEENLRETF